VEDIFTCAITGSVLIKDAVNLFSTFPINGYEKLTVVFKTPGINSKDIKKTFDVVEITDKVSAPNERSEVYRINFISSAAFNDKVKKISKSYKGKISDIAKKVYSEYIGGELNVSETLGEQKYVIPRWSPFKILTWLASRAEPAKKSSETNYLFFENVDGHHFLTLSEVVSKEPIMSYFSMPVSVSTEKQQNGNDIARNFSNVKNSLLLKSSQKLKEQMSGAYSSTLYIHDVTTKQWGRYVYDYGNDKDKVRYITDNHLSKNEDKYTSSPDSKIHLTTKQSGLMGKDFPNTQNHEKWLQRSISSSVLMDTIKMKITTAGNSILRVGDVIELFIPKTGSISKENSTKWYDSNFSGKYLITNLRHTITTEGYTNTMLLAKNSYEESNPDKTSFLNTGNNEKKVTRIIQ
jgi:hypothetical protein